MNDHFSYSSLDVERAVLNELAAQSSLSQTEIAFLLGIDKRRVDPQVQDELSDLDQDYSQQLIGVLRHGLAIFDQHITSFTKWLKTPHPELACPETGFFPVWPTTPPPPLDEMTSSKPYDLVAYAHRRNQQAGPPEPAEQKRPYPTPISLLGTASGIELVDAIFGRIEAGVFM